MSAGTWLSELPVELERMSRGWEVKRHRVWCLDRPVWGPGALWLTGEIGELHRPSSKFYQLLGKWIKKRKKELKIG